MSQSGGLALNHLVSIRWLIFTPTHYIFFEFYKDHVLNFQRSTLTLQSVINLNKFNARAHRLSKIARGRTESAMGFRTNRWRRRLRIREKVLREV